jgi:hypothetical protein
MLRPFFSRIPSESYFREIEKKNWTLVDQEFPHDSPSKSTAVLFSNFDAMRCFCRQLLTENLPNATVNAYARGRADLMTDQSVQSEPHFVAQY